VVLTVLNSFLKQSFLVSTNVTSALEVFFKNDTRYINSRFTYLLTYFAIVLLHFYLDIHYLLMRCSVYICCGPDAGL